MPKENIFIIVKRRTDEKVKYLRHEGHSQFWSENKNDAMEYSKLDVATALAEQHKGTIEPI